MWTRIDAYDLKKPDFLRTLGTSGGMIPAANTGIIVEGSIEDRTKKSVPPQSQTEEIYEDYLVKIKNSRIS
jgi:hypothetical protein